MGGGVEWGALMVSQAGATWTLFLFPGRRRWRNCPRTCLPEPIIRMSQRAGCSKARTCRSLENGELCTAPQAWAGRVGQAVGVRQEGGGPLRQRFRLQLPDDWD